MDSRNRMVEEVVFGSRSKLRLLGIAAIAVAACGDGDGPAFDLDPPPGTTGDLSPGTGADAGLTASEAGTPAGGGSTGSSGGGTPGNGSVAPGNGGRPGDDGGISGNNGGSSGDGGTSDGGTTPSDDDYAQYHDPGTGPWEMGTPEECKMDTSQIGGSDNMAVFRYGKLCHIQGGNTNIQNYSATKTLGGVFAGRAAYLVKDVPRTGPGTGPILHEDKMVDWVGSQSGLNSDALLSHVMAMTAFNDNLAWGSKSFQYDTLGTREISVMLDVSMVAVEQLDGAVPTEERAFMNEEVFAPLGMSDSTWPGGTIGYGWTGSLEDMGRMGVMLVHDGWYGGERFMEASWVYRMSHPTHEDSNTAYGQLAWLNTRGGGGSFGATVDDCAPAAIWPSYPHVGSEATDCGASGGRTCDMTYDVGVFSAQGLGGQFIIMHPGLDLVIVGHNAAGVIELWEDVRPAVVAMDPMFAGDEAAFCEAYGANEYAPDLLVPRVAPTQ